MDLMKLEVQSRSKDVKTKDLLKQNIIPMEYYGRGEDNRSLQVDYQTFRRLFRVARTNTVIEIEVDGKDKLNVLVHDLNFDSVTDKITHVDLIAVKMGEAITASVKFEFVGVAPAVKEMGGVLTHTISDVDITCLPKDLIHSIEVDISSIVDFHSPIRIKDLVLPEGITVDIDPEQVVVSASAPKAAEEENDAPEAEMPGEVGETEEAPAE